MSCTCLYEGTMAVHSGVDTGILQERVGEGGLQLPSRK